MRRRDAADEKEDWRAPRVVVLGAVDGTLYRGAPTKTTGAPVSTTDDLLANARAYAAGFDGGGLGARPQRRVAVVTCMDARLDPARLLGLREGDAHVIRNAGGVVTDDVIRSLTISQRLLGTEEIVVVAHSGCGMLTFSGADLHDIIEKETGIRPTWAAETFRDLDAEVRQGMARIHASPFLPSKASVRGFVYDVDDGTLREVPPV